MMFVSVLDVTSLTSRPVSSAAFAILAMFSIQIVQLNFTFSVRKSLTDTDLHSPVVPDPIHFTYFVVDN